MHGSDGYIVEAHPLLIVMGALVLLAAVWLVLRRR
jgi:LPXTG-motif cell wall-anchored protein